ncbi:MAG: TraB/GumN family protein [Candidatus Woesearchaeota archaeon]
MQYKNLTVIGTSHIAPESLKEIEKKIVSEHPDIVALELDRKRLAALLSKKRTKTRWRDIKQIGIKGYLFSVIGAWIEQKLGKKTGVSPGSEMLLAFRIAQKSGARVALIDQDIEITLKRFSQELSWKEKWHFIVDLFEAFIFGKPDISFDLAKVPTQSVINRMISKVKKRYPNVYKVLVIERNRVMAANLASLLINHPDKKIIAVIGAGHEKEIINLVKYKLKEEYLYT